MKNRKSQAHTQIFIYILSTVLVALILLFGYKSIMNFTSKAEQVSYIKFKTDLESVVKAIAPDYRSIKRGEFIIGKDYRAICFVDSDVAPGATLSTQYPIIQEIIDSRSKENTFLVTDHVEEKFYVGKIEVHNDFICINSTKGRVRIQFEGLGDRTNITTWSFG